MFKACGKIIQDRINKIIELLQYDRLENPEMFYYDWYLGATKYKHLTKQYLNN